MSTHSVDYFIKKFEAIPRELWCTGGLRGRYIPEHYQHSHCVLGHCGVKRMGDASQLTPEAKSLFELFGASLKVIWKGSDMGPNWPKIYSINDKHGGHPKDNVLKALKELKNNRYEQESSSIKMYQES
jgi:hypothetical protein